MKTTKTNGKILLEGTRREVLEYIELDRARPYVEQQIKFSLLPDNICENCQMNPEFNPETSGNCRCSLPSRNNPVT